MSASEIPQHLANNPFQDLSGIDTSSFSNPYDALISLTQNDPIKLQERYSTHRTTRNAQQKAKLLDPHFSGVIIDPILLGLEDPKQPDYVDPRHCLVFWGRPPQRIKELIAEVQRRLRTAAPELWLMLPDNLHITILEITHSKSEAEIAELKTQINPVVEDVVNYTLAPAHRARLVKPLIGFDASALALSFVPAVDADGGGEFGYHHLRRDVYATVSGAGVQVDSRYVVPSAHLTIARFIKPMDDRGVVDKMKMATLVKVIEELNEWLEGGYWGDEGSWTVGEEKGLLLRSGTVWYGGGESVAEGIGF